MDNILFLVTCQTGGKIHFSKTPYNKTLCGFQYDYIGSELDLNDSEDIVFFTKETKHLTCKKCLKKAEIKIFYK